jgi:hypothetical protein
MAFLRLKNNAIISITNSRIASGINKISGTNTPAIVPKKAIARERANVRITDGKNSVDVCVYNFFHLKNYLLLL